jgi:hypothetical protein
MLLRRNRANNAPAIDDFVRKVVAARTLWAVAGADGLARAPSLVSVGREATLFWSEQNEADRWAATVASEPRVKQIPLVDVLNEVLPRLQELQRAVMPNWSPDPADTEIEPRALAERLRVEIMASFVRQVVTSGAVYILEDEHGPTFAASVADPDRLVLPAWPTRPDAEFPRNGFWQEMAISRIPLDTFVDRTLVWLSEIDRPIAPSFTPRIAGTEVAAADLTDRIKRLQRLAAHV